VRSPPKRGLIRRGADDDRGNAVGISEADARFVGGVSSLAELGLDGQIDTDQDEEPLPILLGHSSLLSMVEV